MAKHFTGNLIYQVNIQICRVFNLFRHRWRSLLDFRLYSGLKNKTTSRCFAHPSPTQSPDGPAILSVSSWGSFRMNVHFQSRTSNNLWGKGNTIGLFGQSKRVRSRRGNCLLAVGREARSPAVLSCHGGRGRECWHWHWAWSCSSRRARSRRQLTSAES